jgi:multiple sugar transport system permease protein
MRTKRRLLDNETVAGYIFISPWLINFLLFIVVPMIISFYISFTKYDLIGAPVFNGLKNFKWLLFNDSKFWYSVKITLFYVAVAVPLRLAFALIIALILNKKYRLIGVYRAIYYLPSIIGSSVAIAVVWRIMFGSEGFINKIMSLFGVTNSNISFISDQYTAIWVIILLYMWEFGSSMLIFLAGLKNIPETYYEAAIVEGAGFWSKFFRITLPLLSPVLFFNLIMQLIQGFLTFTQVYIITQGGPFDSTQVYALYMYRRAFEYHSMGEASAMAWMLLVLIGILTAIIFKTSNYWVYYESKEGK